MALIFPPSPTIGDTYSNNGIVYQWNGTVWKLPGGSIVQTVDTPQEGETIIWDNAQQTWVAGPLQDPDTIFAGKTTDDLAEGVTNLYQSTANVDARITTTVDKAFVDALNVDADTLDGVNSNGFASATQGSTADSALQPAAIGVTVQGYNIVLANTTASYTSAEETKLSGIETGATTDQTNAEIKTAYESNLNTNAFLDAEKTKLSGIETLADVTDAANVNAAGAVMNNDATTAEMSFVIDEDTFVTNSATLVPSQQSVKAYVDAAVASQVTYEGGYNAATNTPDLDVSPSGINIGSMYTVTAVGNFYTAQVEIGDVLIAEIDNPTQESHWTIVNKDLNASSIKSSYESNADTNAYTDAEVSKLAGIELNAKDDQSAAEILIAVKSVDGAGSGLDADVLDGEQGTHYLDYNNFTNTPTVASTTTDLPEGTNLYYTDGRSDARITAAIGTTVQAQSAILDATTASFTTADETKLDGLVPNAVDSVNTQTGAVVLDSTDIQVASTSATYNTVQHLQDVFHSAGVAQGGVITDAGAGQITVALGEGLTRATATQNDVIKFMNWPQTTLSLTDAALNYIYAVDNETVLASITEPDTTNNVFLGTVYREGTVLHITNSSKYQVGDHASLMIKRLQKLMPFARESGASISFSNLNFSISSGVFWEGLNRFTTVAYDSSLTTFGYYYTDAAGDWQFTNANIIDNLNYNEVGVGLTVLPNSRYGVHWAFLDEESEMYVVYGTDNYTLAEAEAASVPANLPPFFNQHARIVGRIIVGKSNASITEVSTPFGNTFSASSVSDHGNLTGLLDNDHTQYALNAGLTYPTADGTNGQVITTDGAGTLTFGTPAGGTGGTSISELLFTGNPVASGQTSWNKPSTLSLTFGTDISVSGTEFTIQPGSYLLTIQNIQTPDGNVNPSLYDFRSISGDPDYTDFLFSGNTTTSRFYGLKPGKTLLTVTQTSVFEFRFNNAATFDVNYPQWVRFTKVA